MMRSATDFLPRVINTLMNLATSWLPYFGSGSTWRFAISLRRGILTSVLSFLLLSFQWINGPAHPFHIGSRLDAEHSTLPYAAFGRLAPYLERPCLRSFTPAVSRLPRTTW